MGSGVTGAKWQDSIAKDKVSTITIMEISQRSNQNSLTHAELWHWLVNHGVPRKKKKKKKGRMPIKFLLDLYKEKSSRSSELES